ncbi:unnamed protein product [Closterium sp. Naga37s-1]|nr:unnamed protein product [Closterium sp. Naga37s-1]
MTELGKSTAADDSTVFGDDARNPGEGAGQYVLPSQHLVGDIFGLLSAVSYGVYTTLLRKYVGDDEAGEEKADMQKVFGYIGLVTLLGLWWIVFPLHVVGWEPLAVMPSTVNLDEDIVANSLVGSVVSDYCWALSVVWTTPLVATLGLSLTIPLAMVADMVMHGRQYSFVYILGSVQVFGGFLIANMADKCMGGPATDHESPRFEKEMIDILRSPRADGGSGNGSVEKPPWYPYLELHNQDTAAAAPHAVDVGGANTVNVPAGMEVPTSSQPGTSTPCYTAPPPTTPATPRRARVHETATMQAAMLVSATIKDCHGDAMTRIEGLVREWMAQDLRLARERMSDSAPPDVHREPPDFSPPPPRGESAPPPETARPREDVGDDNTVTPAAEDVEIWVRGADD